LAVAFAVGRGLSERRATVLAGVHRSSARYQAPKAGDAALLERLRRIRDAHPRFGVPRVVALLRADGVTANHKRVERLWRAAGFQVPRRRRRGWKRPKVEPQPDVPCVAERPNHVWTYDFIEDGLIDGRKLRLLNVLDEFTREWLAVKAGASMSGKAVVAVLGPLFRERGAPAFVRSDNGGEFIAAEVREALKAAGATPAFIAPGSPWRNGFVESFHGKLRDECLDREAFASVRETQVCLEGHRRFYNEERPHSALGYVSPAAFRRGWEAGRQTEREV
jgi:putative transposase